MNIRPICVLTFSLLSSVMQGINTVDPVVPNDTIKTYNIGDVVITSSAKETNDLRTLPGSVSLISPQVIAARQITALKDMSSFVPNLYIPDYGAKLTSAIYIRGIGARSSGQSVGLYVDNVPYLDKSTFDFELMDIQRIEVLRGPQGTLYGRNAMGGIINIYTLSPFDYQGTKVILTAGNYGTYKAKASHYARIGEKFGISLGGYYHRNGGFFTNQYTNQELGIYPEKIDREESVGGRFKLDGRFSRRLTAAYTLAYDYTDQGAFAYGLYNKETGILEPVNFNDPSSYNRRMLTNNLSLEYRTDRVLLTSTTGYQYLKDDMLMDQDYSPASIFILNQKQKQHAFSEEIALKSLTSSDYQWSLGMYGFYNDLHTEGPVTFKEDGIREILQEQVFDKLYEDKVMPVRLQIRDDELYIPGSFDTPSYGAALFHQSTYNNLFTRGLSLTAGIRLDYEKQKMHYQSESKMTMGLYGTNVIIPTDTTFMNERISQDFWQLLPKVSLRYECTPRTFTYLSVAKGYKTGGYNVQMSADVMQNQMQYEMMDKYTSSAQPPEPIEEVMAYSPEHSWNYEMGIRSELLPGSLSAELTLFYTDIRDLQITQFVKSGNGRILTNAGKARSYGVEASLRSRLNNKWTADLNYGYTHATLRNYIHQEKVNGEIIDLDCEGNFIPYIPHHTLNLGVNYSTFFRNKFIDQLTASAQFSGTGKIYWTEINDIDQAFYGVVNAKIGVRKGIVKLDLWSRNLTDTQYSAFYFESRGNPFIQKGKPFQIGVDLSLTL